MCLVGSLTHVARCPRRRASAPPSCAASPRGALAAPPTDRHPNSHALLTYVMVPGCFQKDVVFVRGARTPFVTSGGEYSDYLAYDLQREAIKGLLTKTGVQGSDIEYVSCGTVIQEVLTSNIAREASMAAGIPLSTPAHTVTLACISSNVAMATGVDKIKTGQVDTFLAGGVETMSDTPIRLSRPLRKRALGVAMFKKNLWSQLASLKPADIGVQVPSVSEFSTGEVMGHSADRLASAFGITRAAQDKFAQRSHTLAKKAQDEGLFDDEIIPIKTSGKDTWVTKDNGIRPSTDEQMAKLKPAFVKPHGTVTAANASFLTDGASAALMMSQEKCSAMGLKARSIMKDYTFVSCDPKEQLLLGPAFSIAKLLKKNNLRMEDIGVWEFHEAFAGQVLSNLSALDSQSWCEKWLGQDRVGEMPMELTNTRGGSLSVGHPFGATGVRLATWGSDRLKAEDKEFAVLAACAAGGQGVAMLLERHPDW